MSTEGHVYASALGRPTSANELPAAPPPVLRIVEALLFASGQPLTAERASSVIRDLSAADFRSAVEELGRLYRRQNRPYTVQTIPEGYVLALRPRYRPVRERLDGSPRETRLSRAAIDVLAIIAYRQPISAADIDSQRGSDSAAVIRQLVRLGLVVAEGHPERTFSTTARFLELFGLKSLDDLPRTMDLRQV